MSVSCVGTCSACGVRRLWLSDTFSLQLDDGSLKCLRHPGEDYDCEEQGLTLAQASQRGRLYRETFYVCRSCGRTGEFIEQRPPFRDDPIDAFFPVRNVTKFSLVLVAIPVPVALWFRWWGEAFVLGFMAVWLPWYAWRANRKAAAALAARGLPRRDAPGRVAVGPPTRGFMPGVVIGRKLGDSDACPAATGPCCDQPNWQWAGGQRDEDRIPCCACGGGVMTISETSID